MTSRAFAGWSAFIAAVLVVAISAVWAQAPGDFASEPDKSMASAHESFLKGDLNKASEHIKKAAGYVRKEGNKVAKDAAEPLKKAAADLDRLGQNVKKGAVKSGDDLKKSFAQVDHQLALAWHKTADEATKAGKDSTNALKKAAAGLAGAATWSGVQLQAGAQASVAGVAKVGQGVKLGAEDVGRFFKGIGDGIADVGQKLTASR
jgi:hypothetical protein